MHTTSTVARAILAKMLVYIRLLVRGSNKKIPYRIQVYYLKEEYTVHLPPRDSGFGVPSF